MSGWVSVCVRVCRERVCEECGGGYERGGKGLRRGEMRIWGRWVGKEGGGERVSVSRGERPVESQTMRRTVH